MEPITGKVWKYGDDVNTDVIFAGKYTYTLTDPAEMAKVALEDLDPEFAPNVQKNDVIVAGRNFGCGSSREHAPWSLEQYGFRVILASSFADIFFNNCFKNGLLPIEVSSSVYQSLVDVLAGAPGSLVIIDLPSQRVSLPDGFSFDF